MLSLESAVLIVIVVVRMEVGVGGGVSPSS